MRVRLLREYDPLVNAAADLQRRYPIRAPTRFPGQWFDGVNAEEIYFYPVPTPAAVQ